MTYSVRNSMKNKTPEEILAIKMKAVVGIKLRKNESKDDIVSHLIGCGMSKEMAAQLYVETKLQKDVSARKSAYGQMAIGGLILIIGVGMTALSHNSGGGTVYIGAIVVGIIGVGRGMLSMPAA